MSQKHSRFGKSAMQHFPIFLNVAGRRIVLSGGGDAALAKLRLIMKSEAHITVFSAEPAAEIVTWAEQGKLRLVRRAMDVGDAVCAALFYAADEDAAEDARTSATGCQAAAAACAHSHQRPRHVDQRPQHHDRRPRVPEEHLLFLHAPIPPHGGRCRAPRGAR